MNTKNKINVAVLFGGKSGEHEVSIASAKSVISNLNRKLYNVIPVAITKEGQWLNKEKSRKLLENAPTLLKNRTIPKINQNPKQTSLDIIQTEKKHIDVVFPVLHGSFGEDGTIQGMLEMMNMPFVGSDTLASALAMDKQLSKKIFIYEKILTPDFWYISGSNFKTEIKKIKTPCVVKPINLGSSVGVTIVKTNKELKQAIEVAQKADRKGEVLIEKMIIGREITVPILGEKALPVIEIKPKQKGDWFDYLVKYNPELVDEIVPADISKPIYKKAQEIALLAHKALKCRHLSRADMIVENKTNKIYLLEVNTMPGMTNASLLPKSANASGIPFSKLLDKLIKMSLS